MVVCVVQKGSDRLPTLSLRPCGSGSSREGRGGATMDVDTLPQVAAAEPCRESPGATLPRHAPAGPVAEQGTGLLPPPRVSPEDGSTEGGSAGAGGSLDAIDSPTPPAQAAQHTTTTAASLQEAPRIGNRRKDLTLNCNPLNFPLRECVAGGVNVRTTHGRLARRPGRRGPCLAALRDAGLETFDENEESDYQESETDTEATQADTTDAESDCTAGLESDVEGAVGGDTPEVLAPPGTPGERRASIVTADSRRDEIVAAPEPVKVAVFGTDGVGKSALIVRLLTGRFIGEYDPSLEAVYSYRIPLPGHALPLMVMDTAGHVEVVEAGRERQVAWGEGFMLVFSLTSHASFTALHHLRRVIQELTPGSPRPMVVVGNKADLAHARQVNDAEIRDLAAAWGCDYFEVAAPEPWEVVVRPFAALYQAVLNSRATTR